MQEGLGGHAGVEVTQRALANRVDPANVAGAGDADLPMVDQWSTTSSYPALRLGQACSVNRPASNCKDASINLAQEGRASQGNREEMALSPRFTTND